MHAMRAAWIALLGLLAAATVLPLSAGVANATCGSYQTNHLFATWADSQPDHAVAGVRAGVQVRTDSDICSPGNGLGTALWIGIQSEDGTHLVQAGFYYLRDSSGQMHRCRFYEDVPLPPHTYGGCSPVEGRYNYWSIHKYFNGSGNSVGIEDCDQDSTYQGCDLILSGIDPERIHNGFAELSGETQNPGCQNTMMGDGWDPANIGNGTNPVEVEHDAGDPWIHSENLALKNQDGGAKCSHYHKSLPHPNAFTVWDDRNAS